MSEMALVKLEQARMLLAECRTVVEAKQFRDMAVAAEVYAQQAKLGEEMEAYAREVKLRAERRIGEILITSPLSSGRPKRNGSTQNHFPTLKDLGLDKKLSSRAQKLAQLELDLFEQVAVGALELKQVLSPRKERIVNDFYPTDGALTRALLERVTISGRVFQPCAGAGDMVQVLRGAGLEVDCGDIAPQFEGCAPFDATRQAAWNARDEALEDKLWAQDWTVDNPPFESAMEILDLAHRHSRLGVAFLLRLSWLEPCQDRRDWMMTWRDNLRYVITFSPRPAFRADSKGRDSVTVSWFVWEKAFSWKALGLECPFDFVWGWR